MNEAYPCLLCLLLYAVADASSKTGIAMSMPTRAAGHSSAPFPGHVCTALIGAWSSMRSAHVTLQFLSGRHKRLFLRSIVWPGALNRVRSSGGLALLCVCQCSTKLSHGNHSCFAPAGVDVVTLGQYMRPTKRHMPVSEYVTPRVLCSVSAGSRRDGIPLCSLWPHGQIII